MTTIDRDFIAGLTLTEKASLVIGHDFWFTAQVSHVRPMMMTDGPSGLRKQSAGADALGINDSVKAVAFPTSALTACSFDESLLHQLGEQLGIAARAEDLGVLLGPGVNIKRSPLAGRNFEYFSEDPLVAGKLATAYVNGVQSQGVGVSVKHFAANNRENERFTSSSNIDERTLREIYLSQFERIVKEAHPATIMCSYNKLNGVQVSNNQRLLTDILRNEWGFDGLVMSDWGAVVDHVAAIKAGLDLEMPGKGQASIDEIVTAVKEGRLQESRLDIAVERVLKMVEKWQPATDQVQDYDKEAQHRFARQVADESIVLLKNDQQELPLHPNQETVAMIGELAAQPRYQGGGSSHVNAVRVVTPLDAKPTNVTYVQGYSLADDDSDAALFDQAIAAATASDRVIIFAGYPEEMESEGFDKTAMCLPENQNQLIMAVANVNPHVTVVLQNGSAVEMPWVNDVQAVVETYLAGEAVGEATWDILTGKVNPSGKLAETFPIKVSDNPTALSFNQDQTNENYHEGLFVGYRYYDKKHLPVLFPFGHGLSYTDFTYDHLEIKAGPDTVTVSFNVTNTGHVAGKETAQLYIGNQTSPVEMPLKELRDFAKVALEPGQAQTVTMVLPRRSFAWYNSTTGTWEADNGEYLVMVGSSSRDIRLQKSFNLTIGTDQLAKITGETYVHEIWQTGNQRIEEALQQSGLDQKLAALLGHGSDAIFANIPLRSLGMAGITNDQIQRFIRLVND
ncbi:glycoside hydrolase family 3 C-terminal domain-containing protein [Limosilactobacillus caecicola]|uniref:glycoside hydrolase family 3 C-terminal domain-containing protein n=1 Tax=Limosilactobacillus caecicola TaxID=2941332 RepID=UPI0038995C46